MDKIFQELETFVYLIVFYPGSRQFWLYGLIYIILGMLLVWIYSKSPTSRASVFSSLKGLFPKKIYRHPSFKMDLKFVLIYFSTVRIGAVGLVIGGTTLISRSLVELIHSNFFISNGYIAPLAGDQPNLSDRVVFTLITLVVLDFGYFIAHFLSHRIPLLWSFHQVHHAAEHLTPLTASRFHPLDYLWTVFVSTLLSSLVVTSFTLYHSVEVQLVTVLNLLFAFFIFNWLSNFRHSHVWISFGPYVSRVLVSPCMHQIHHSTSPHHLDKNFGLMFSFWDKVFGSIYIPNQREIINTGLGNDRLSSDRSFLIHLLLPVKDALKSVKRRSWWVSKQ